MRSLLYEIVSNRVVIISALVVALILPYVCASIFSRQGVNILGSGMGMVSSDMVDEILKDEIGLPLFDNTTTENIRRQMVGSTVTSTAIGFLPVYILAGIFSQILFAFPLHYGHISYDYMYSRKTHKPFISRFLLLLLFVFVFSLPLTFTMSIKAYNFLIDAQFGQMCLLMILLTLVMTITASSYQTLIALLSGSPLLTTLSGFGFMFLSLWNVEMMKFFVPVFWIFSSVLPYSASQYEVIWLMIPFVAILLGYLVWRWKNV